MRTLTLTVKLIMTFMMGGAFSWVPHVAFASSALVEKQQAGIGVHLMLPLYEPKMHRPPKARIEGGTRGSDSGGLVVLPLVPDHVGLTISSQPDLYWYLSKPTTSQVMFVLVDTRSIRVVHEASLLPSTGVQLVRLKDLGVILEPNVLYRWYLTVIVDRNLPARDIVSGGMIERIRAESNVSDFTPLHAADAVQFYAQNGLWYDALASVSDLISAAPDNRLLRRQRASLLQQVGLHEAAEWDMLQIGNDDITR
jgi:Domain of Unknown Function (DUF928)